MKFKRFILVDDDYINNFLNEEIIREMDITEEIITFTNGSEALEWLTKTQENVNHKLDILFLDINMPGLDGFEILSEIKASEILCQLPIVLLTTSDNVRDKDKAQNFKVNGYINKPLSKDKIHSCLQLINNKDLTD